MGFNQASGVVHTLRSRAGGILTFFGGMWNLTLQVHLVLIIRLSLRHFSS